MGIWSSLKAQPASPELIQGKEAIDQSYKHWRVRTMYAMFIGYAIYYFCRKNLSAAQPALIQELGYSKTQMGMIWSALYLTYGLSKMVNGLIGDRANPRYFMAIGLLLSAVVNVFFGLSSSLVMLGVLWGVNGWVQGMGWPPCARLLTQWYSPSERGTSWAIWNTAHQVGGGLILVLAGYLTEHYGWRTSFYVPAVIAVLVAFFLAERLRDTPESLGLPPVEVWRGDTKTSAGVSVATGSESFRSILFDHVLKNPEIWLLAIANFFVYLVRYGAMDWAPTFLVEVKHSTVANASYKTALFEIAGIAGSVLAGRLIDTHFRNHRALVNVIYMVLLVFAVWGFWMIPTGHPWLECFSLAAVGFLVYGPQMLVGLCAADAGGKYAAATASGFTGLFGYIGSIASGVGTGLLVDRFGWVGGFAFFTVSALIGVFCFVGVMILNKKRDMRSS